MRPATIRILTAFLMCGLVPGCGSSSKVNPDEIIGLFEEATGVLKGIKDKKSVEEARPKLMQLGEKIRAAREEATRKNPAFTAKGATLPEAEQKRMDAVSVKFGEEINRVQKIEGGKDLVKDFHEAMNGKKGGEK